MKDWLAEILVVLAYSSRTQFAIVLGMVSFVGLMEAGDYFVGRIELHGALAHLACRLVGEGDSQNLLRCDTRADNF